MVDMSVKIGSVTLKNPIMPASGAFSTELAQVMDINRLGALVTKTVSREYRIGNPPPRVAEVEGGMINSIGLPTKGHRVFPRAPASRLQALHAAARRQHHRRPPPTISRRWRATSTCRTSTSIEMNISCPTREPGGGNFALHEDHTYEIVQPRARRDRQAALGEALAQRRRDRPGRAWRRKAAGADALTISNTLSGLKINTETFRPAIGNGYGGLSGPGIKPIILRMVHQCSKAVKIPIIGCGGIVKVEDVVEYMLAGASAVMIGYLTFRNPSGMIAHHRRAGAMVRQARLCARRRPHRRDDLRQAGQHHRRRGRADRLIADHDHAHHHPQARRLAPACARRRHAQGGAAVHRPAFRPRHPDAEPRAAGRAPPQDAIAYRERVHGGAAARARRFKPLMTCYLTDDTDPDDVERGFRDGVFTGVKLYPANATTNSAAGVTDYRKIMRVLERMEKIGMPFLMHGEDVDPEIDIFDREAMFIERLPVEMDAGSFPGLRMILEHLSSKDGVDFVEQRGAAGRRHHHALSS